MNNGTQRMTAGRRFLLYFAPPLFQGIVTLLMLPLVTLVLGPAEFGIFALVTGLTALGTVFATMGSGYILAQRFPEASRETRQSLVSTQLIIGLAASSAFAVLFLGGWLAAAPYYPPAAEVPLAAVLLCLAALPIAAPWALASEILVLESEASTFAVVTVLQTLVSSASTLLGLFVLDIGVLALFWASFASATTGTVGAALALRRYLTTRIHRRDAYETLRLGVPLAASNGLDAGYVAVERALLGGFVGLSAFGIYTHSQQYLGFAVVAVKALVRTVWPITLQEAREGDLFERTGAAWRFGYAAVTAAGLGLALVGGEVIGLLTHGKFSAAAPLAALWMIVLLLRLSGRPQLGILYSRGQGQAMTIVRSVATASSLLVLVLLVPAIGVLAGVAAAVWQAVFVRVCYEFAAKRLASAPWQDSSVVIGSGAILGAVCLAAVFDLGLTVRLGVLFASIVLLLLVLRPLKLQGLLEAPLLGKEQRS